MKYRVILEPRGSGFEAALLAFPNVRASGETQTAALDALRHALAKAIEFEVASAGAQDAAHLVYVQIDVNTGKVSREGQHVQLRGATLALAIALAVEQGEVSHDTLCRRLYPETPPEQGYNALKMTVHRARHVIGAKAIATTEGGYRLAEDVVVDIRFLPQIVRAIRTRSVARAIEERLPEIFERLYRGRPAAYSAWEWFAPTERLLQRMTREIGLYLGQRALRGGNPVAALDYARRLVTRDLLDEAAYELAIRAHLARGNRASALLEFRAYAGRLKDQVGTEPSASFQRLLEVTSN